MSLSNKQKFLISLTAIMTVVVTAGCFLYPPEIRYNSYLVPVLPQNEPAFSQDEETNSVIYDIGGSSVEVKYLTDTELNTLFPVESTQGLYSTNPYTYGNWLDPDLGYTPNKFTVFSVTIINRTFAKMRIDPVEAVLITDLGETLHSYTFSVAAAKYNNSFEDYYRSRRGQSGNDYYRYEMRLGMVRGKNFGLDEMVFRGDTYSGLISFDTLRPDVKRVQLILNDIVFRFDAFNRPADVTTAKFNFERKIDKLVITQEMKQKEMEREKVRIKMSGPQQIINNRINDNDRAALAIDKAMTDISPLMEKCFMERYRRNEVDPGRMVVSFTISNEGIIVSQNVTEVIGINSENFMNCVLTSIKTMKFAQIQDLPLEGTGLVKGPAKAVNVLYPLEFQVYMEEEKQ